MSAWGLLRALRVFGGVFRYLAAIVLPYAVWGLMAFVGSRSGSNVAAVGVVAGFLWAVLYAAAWIDWYSRS